MIIRPSPMTATCSHSLQLLFRPQVQFFHPPAFFSRPPLLPYFAPLPASPLAARPLFSLWSLWLPLFSARRERLAPPPAFSPAPFFAPLSRRGWKAAPPTRSAAPRLRVSFFRESKRCSFPANLRAKRPLTTSH